MRRKAYIQPLTEIVDVKISDALLSASTFEATVDLDNENEEVPEARRKNNSVWDDVESEDEDLY